MRSLEEECSQDPTVTWDQIGGPNCGFFALKISLGQRGQTPWPLRPEEDSCRRPRETEGRAPGKEDLPYYLNCPAPGTSGWRRHRVRVPYHQKHSKHRLDRSMRMCPQ